MRAGIFSDTDTCQSGLEGFGRGKGDSDRITQYQDGVGVRAGGGAPRPEAKKRQCQSLAGDKAHAGDFHAQRNGVRCLCDACRERASRDSCSVMER